MPCNVRVVGRLSDHVTSWRRQGQANRQNHDRSSGTGTPTKDSGRQQAMPAPPGNAWGVKATAAGAAPATRNPTQTQATEQHAPVQDFNANEVKEFLRKSTWTASCWTAA